MADIGLEKIEAMVKAIMNTVDNEIGCADCFAVLDQFIDLKAQGKNAAEIMPLVQGHLERCRDCHEEYDAILQALDAAA
jgi:hypothetical protein